MGGCCNTFCNNRNNTCIIWVAIIALVLVNCLDDDCVNKLGNFFQALGDTMVLGTSSGCCGNCRGQELQKNFYY